MLALAYQLGGIAGSLLPSGLLLGFLLFCSSGSLLLALPDGFIIQSTRYQPQNLGHLLGGLLGTLARHLGDQIQAIPMVFVITLAAVPGAPTVFVIKVETILATTAWTRAMPPTLGNRDTQSRQYAFPLTRGRRRDGGYIKARCHRLRPNPWALSVFTIG